MNTTTTTTREKVAAALRFYEAACPETIAEHCKISPKEAHEELLALGAKRVTGVYFTLAH